MDFGRPWTPEEDQVLREHYWRVRGCARVAQLLDRSFGAVRNRAWRLGLRARRKSIPWTPAEDLALRRAWGEIGERTFRQHLPGRTATAIYQRAARLGLPPQSNGRVGCANVAQHLGVDDLVVDLLVREAGLTPALVAPITTRRERRPRRGLEVDAIECLWRIRENRCSSAFAWDREHGLGRSTTSNRLRRNGFAARRGAGGKVWIARDVLQEIADGAPGAAVALWKRAHAVSTDVGCAAWVLYTAAQDLLAGPEAGEWVGLWLPQRAARAARVLAGLRPDAEERAA